MAEAIAPTPTPNMKPKAPVKKVVPAQGPVGASPDMADPVSHTGEAKSRFNAALDEAKAGAAALKAEAGDRAGAYRAKATEKSDDLVGDAKIKAGEMAVDGKGKASDALSGMSKYVAENAAVIDEKLGAKYGDYARSASRSLQESAVKLDNKSVDELSEDARRMVRQSPGMAVGIAAVAGFMISRLFRR